MARRRRPCCGCGYVATTGILVSFLALLAVAANLYVLRPAPPVQALEPLQEAIRPQEPTQEHVERRVVDAARQEGRKCLIWL